MLPKGKVGEFTVGGKAYPVYVNVNTCARFDELSDRSLNSILLGLQSTLSKLRREAEASGEAATDEAIAYEALGQTLSVKNLRVLASAALHSYDVHKEPVYAFTPGQLGGVIDYVEFQSLIPLLVQGLTQLSARNKDLPRSMQKGDTDARPEDPTSGPTTERAESDGGQASTGLAADILDSLEKISDEKPSEASSFDGAPGKSESSEPILEQHT